MLTLIDRPHQPQNTNLQRMIAELSPHMTEFEIDRVVEFLWTIDQSRWDINYSVDDAATQLRILLGSERYEIIKGAWAHKNQHLIKSGTTKYRHRETGLLYDGLDPTDDPQHYQRILV